jgi:hypothetical protein
MSFAEVLSLVGALLLYGVYDIYKSKKSEETKRQKEAEQKANHEKFKFEYEAKQRAAIKETKSHQERPDDWDLRKSYILKRDGYKCVRCGSYQNLHVHHKIPVSTRPDHSETNLITLCIQCHGDQKGPGHNSLLPMTVGKQCNKYNFQQLRGRKEYKCDSCGGKIIIGQQSYKKSYWYRSVKYSANKTPDHTIRICEDCLLSFNDYSDKFMKRAH